MKLPRRRQFLHLAAGVAALPAVSRFAWAQAYPTRPVRIIFGLASGSAGDILARLIGQWLSERLGQPFVIENRVGAGGTLAAEAVVRSPPDGYTLLACGSPDEINATLNDKLNFVFLRDIAPIAGIARGPHVLVVHPSFPAKTIPEFIAYAKANPGKVNFGSAGIGTMAHMAPELFKVMAGIDMVHVPYRGLAPALTDLIGGQVQAIFSTNAPGDRAHQSRQAARVGSDLGHALRGAAGAADHWRFPAGLRSDLYCRPRRAQECSCGNRRPAQQRNQRCPCGSRDKGPAGRPRHRASADDVHGFRQAPRR
jgi:tripartite-type tricarboxylate transporter receptor subunit TctC